ncbi:uncharacterized protein LOC132737016 [Ruditapes philippinarum]|uniref:uncharacterized protein LOC132737016 n=1 Tax=Ruditapes philippinarum TaxID=129788 RepID=UPI00295B8CB2|nr:uncharacterized protein LOC132737016 [Ruditapes philippinarum]
MDEVKQIKLQLESIKNIEKQVTSINQKLSEVEKKMKSMDSRLEENEKSCDFMSSELDKSKLDVKKTKEDLKKMHKSVQGLEKNSDKLFDKTEKLDEQLVDLESRSMRNNLLFYGIPEEGTDENCKQLAKDFCKNILKISSANEFVFDNAHRIGEKKGSKPRPVVVRFHYLEEREAVRKSSFERDIADAMKSAKRGVGAQLPRSVREARKPLYPVMKRARDEHKNVKFIGKKLFIEGEEYIPDIPME